MRMRCQRKDDIGLVEEVWRKEVPLHEWQLTSAASVEADGVDS